MQVFLRLVRPGRGTIDSRRRIPLQDLTDLDLDPVVLSDVLGAFAKHGCCRSIATLSRASPWWRSPRGAIARVGPPRGWIDRYRTQIRRHEALTAAVEEWEGSGRDDDYLLTGSRLARIRGVEPGGAARPDDPRTLRTSRRASLGVAPKKHASGAASRPSGAWSGEHGFDWSASQWRSSSPSAHSGTQSGRPALVPCQSRLVHTVNSEIDGLNENGFEPGHFGLRPHRQYRVYDGLNGANELRSLSEEGVGLIIVPGALLDDWQPVVREHPNTRYVLSFPYDAPNVSYFTSADQQGSFLVGAAAAAKTKTGVIGFLGGLDADFIWPFEAGFEAGARAVIPTSRS